MNGELEVGARTIPEHAKISPPSFRSAATAEPGDLLAKQRWRAILCRTVKTHVEKKPMGAYEILVGSFLNTCLDGFARASNYGRAVSDMLFDFGAGLSQRRPDVAYMSYDRWSRQRRVPRTQAWAVVPELAVEVISLSKTFEAVVSNVHEYFQADVQHVWVVAPPQQQVYVYQSPSHIRVLSVQDELTDDPFLPGFCLKLSELFDVEATEA